MPGMPKGSTYAAEHIVILIVFLSLATSAVGLRIWARRIQKVSLALNDYLILAGLVCTRNKLPRCLAAFETRELMFDNLAGDTHLGGL